MANLLKSLGVVLLFVAIFYGLGALFCGSFKVWTWPAEAHGIFGFCICVSFIIGVICYAGLHKERGGENG